MTGGLVPYFLLCGAAGLTLGLAPMRSAVTGVAAFLMASLATRTLDLGAGAVDTLLTGLLLTTVATAALAFVSQRISRPASLAIGINGGVWFGGAATASSAGWSTVAALSALLLTVPTAMIANRGLGIAAKVLASWIMAIAALSLMVSLTPTPGYRSDHRE